MSGIFRHVPWHPRRPPRWLPTYTTADPVNGPPNVRVFLDDGTGTFPYDVSAWVRLVDGVTTSGYGRGDENTAVTSTQLTLTLDNSDGRFTLGAVGYGIAVDQKIRVKHNGVNRFTGYVQSWPVRWAPAGFQALTTISATDEWARLSRFVLRSMIEEEILTAGASAYYPCDDPTGSVAAGDTSGNNAPPLTIKTNEVGTAPPTFDGTVVTFPADSDPLAVDLDPLFNISAGATFRCSFNVPVAPSSALYLLRVGSDSVAAGGHIRARVDSAGLLVVTNGFITTYYTGPNVADGEDHDLLIVLDGTNYLIYLDGVFRDTSTATFTGSNLLRVGGVVGTDGHTMSNVAAYPTALTAAQAGYQADALFGTATSDETIARVAALVGSPTGTIAAGLSTLVYPDFAGTSAADVLNSVAEGEAGVVYVDGSGDLRFVNRNTRPLTLTAAFTADTATEIVGADTEVVSDMSDVVNYATGTRSGGAPQLVKHAASISAHGRYPSDLSPWVGTDDEARDRAGWLVGKHANPAPRIPQLTLDLLTANASVVAAALALDIGSRIALSHMPTQTPGTIGDLMVEGWTETVTDQSWTLELNCTAWALQSAWILDSATYSLLDSTTLLGV